VILMWNRFGSGDLDWLHHGFRVSGDDAAVGKLLAQENFLQARRPVRP
jgi:hypothetical protein